MLTRRHGHGYNFMGDPATGETLRWGADIMDNPARAPWPELADIAIGNRCSHGCAYCYRDSLPDGPLMAFEQYAFALDRLQSPRWGNVFQVAIGGGEPLEHPDLLKILRYTKERGIVANFTTNGSGLDASMARCAGECTGAVAVSAASLDGIDRRAVNLLVEAGARVNIHYVLSQDSMEEAIDILLGKRNKLLSRVNAVVFLTLKPMGRARKEDCLREGPTLRSFLAALGSGKCGAKIGFDACFAPILLRDALVNRECMDACEGASFSIFIDENLFAKPCSFASNDRYSFDLERLDMDFIWNEAFEPFRAAASLAACEAGCAASQDCRGPCPYHPGVPPCSPEVS